MGERGPVKGNGFPAAMTMPVGRTGFQSSIYSTAIAFFIHRRWMYSSQGCLMTWLPSSENLFWSLRILSLAVNLKRHLLVTMLHIIKLYLWISLECQGPPYGIGPILWMGRIRYSGMKLLDQGHKPIISQPGFSITWHFLKHFHEMTLG